jgi:hypothetical protein
MGPLREAGQTLATIAGTLNDMKVETSRGGRWTPMQVKRVPGPDSIVSAAPS